MPKNWPEIESIKGFENAERFAKKKIYPILEAGVTEAEIPNRNALAAFTAPLMIGFIVTVITVNVIAGFIPAGFLRTISFVILFPATFIAIAAIGVRFMKDKIIDLMITAKASFITRSKALTQTANFLNLTYVPAPGGAPSTLTSFSRWIGKPARLEELIALLDESGGLHEAVDIAQRGGLLLSKTIVLGNEADKEKLVRQTIEMQGLQDGFHGTHKGVSFSAFEWVQSMEDVDDIFHLVLVLPTPTRLHSITELRTRNTDWPYSGVEHNFEPVEFGARAFNQAFKVRSTDQTEARQVFNPATMERVIALAGSDKLRAVAFPEGLALDIQGSDRFAISNLVTGEWSADTVQRTFSDLAELLHFVETSARSFLLPDTH